jgi:hypothetical protein
MKLKNTQITGLNELVIDGRTKRIQWTRESSARRWFRNDFSGIGIIENRNLPLKEQKKIKWAYHYEIAELIHHYDNNPKKYKTWISGNTFNVVVKRR